MAGVRKFKELPSILLPKIECSDERTCQQLEQGGNFAIKYIEKSISRCSKSKADEAFMFLSALLFLVTFTLGWFRLKKGC